MKNMTAIALTSLLIVGCSTSTPHKIWSTGEVGRSELYREGEEPAIAIKAFRNSVWPDEGYRIWSIEKLLGSDDHIVGYKIGIHDPKRYHGRGSLMMTIDKYGRIVKLVDWSVTP